MKQSSDNEAVRAGNFLFLGEHAALDFANTLLAANGAPFETLTSYEDVLRWLVLTRLISEADQSSFLDELNSVAKRQALLGQIRDFRDLWKTNLARLVAGKTVTPDFIDRVNQFLADDLNWSVLAEEAGTRTFQIHSRHISLEPAKKILALLANEMAQFLGSAKLEYLRHCAGPDCVIYFYDTTKSHRRQWCSMAICGNRHKVARFRAKNETNKNQRS